MIAYFLCLLIACFVSLIAGHYLPPLPIMEGARIYLMPVIFFFAAYALPFWTMLALATICGLMWDLLTLQVVTTLAADGTMAKAVEIIPGWSIIVYALLGAIMNGFHPLYLRGRWEIHTLFSGIFVALMVALEFILISVRRAAFYENAPFVFSAEIGWRIAGAGFVALAIAPFIYWGLTLIGRLIGYDPHEIMEREGVD